ncbi:hypothetical protein RBU61_04325 [Tissierella sp. MB52-C2]|uniref:hypothetical protein n=1 Tax=Tissierella sp. MB52-C2 TaxID=3070999 RepID=UPI00280ADF58|nr:hypothetical protein [Tissierella sp. MB52-C2]WMM25901.1 hypothetical protein RBU61_04305 [Tissierella sp. MB52-C2]WMM25905.1 hypothetical protein RBU61_04325 [Tissierella sp. MB52-C2]
MKYLVQPMVGSLILDKEDHEVGTNCIARCIADDSCYNYEICYTPTGPKMIQTGINPADINTD